MRGAFRESVVIGIAPGSNNTPSKRVPLKVWSALISLLVKTITAPFEFKSWESEKIFQFAIR